MCAFNCASKMLFEFKAMLNFCAFHKLFLTWETLQPTKSPLQRLNVVKSSLILFSLSRFFDIFLSDKRRNLNISDYIIINGQEERPHETKKSAKVSTNQLKLCVSWVQQVVKWPNMLKSTPCNQVDGKLTSDSPRDLFSKTVLCLL